MENIGVFVSENVQFLKVKFSIYLNRRVFVMTAVYSALRGHYPENPVLSTVLEI